MALIWHESRDGVAYEVRSHGKTLRLYANGIQHSEYNPSRLVTGSVWDLLWLPLLFDEPSRFRRVLVLGLGGGSLVPPLKALAAPELIVAVEKDPLHLAVARDQFGVAREGVQCHCADAVEFVDAYDGPPFDLVIEDLFAPHDRTVSRAVPATGRWLGKLSSLVSDDGMLVMNFGDWAEYRASRITGRRSMRGWKQRYRFATRDCHNAVIVFRRTEGNSATLRNRIHENDELAPHLGTGLLNYTVRKLDG